MKFPKLVIQNFMAITNATITLSDRGLVAIQGVNKADTSALSNGAGKSSIADALSWCWYGTTARGASGDDIINDIAGKNCFVSSTVQDGAILYTATRHRKHSKGKNSLTLTAHDGFIETDLTKGTDKLTQAEADKVIGSSLAVFNGSIYAGQDNMPDLPSMTDKALKMLVEEAAGTSLLEEAYKNAGKALSEAQIDLTFANDEVDRCLLRAITIENDQTAARASHKEWVGQRSEKIKTETASLRGIISDIKLIDAEIALFDKPDILKKIGDIDAKIAGLSKETDKLSELTNALTTAKAQVDVATKNEAAAVNEISVIDTQISNISSKLGTPCPDCGRPITEGELAASKKSLLDRKDKLANSAIDARDYYVEWFDKLEKAEEERNKFAASMTNVSAEQADRAALVDQLTKLEAITSSRAVKIATAQGVRGNINTANTSESPFTSILEKLEKDKAANDSHIDDAKKKASFAEIKVDTEKEVVRVFSPKGVRARILDEVTPFLNIQTSKYLTTLSDGNLVATWSTLVPSSKKGEYKEQFSVDVTNATGGKKFRLISGGEKRKVRIATALALQDLVATRASKPIDLFIGDEIDDALDDAGLERLMTILDEKAKERGSVFIISHNDLKDHIRNTMTIEKSTTGETSITETTA